MKTTIIYILFVLLISALYPVRALAQQTIITVPSSEILPLGEILFKESNRFRPFNHDKYVNLTPSVSFGTGFNDEVTIGVNTSIADDTEVKANLNYKKVFFLTRGTRFTLGTKISPYLDDAITPENFTYAHLSARIKKTKTTLTSGMFVAGDGHFLPDKPGVILGLEQVIIPNKLRLGVDWTSRNESYGLLGVGLKYKPVPSLSITNGILIPNGNRGKLAFLISISKYVSLNK